MKILPRYLSTLCTKKDQVSRHVDTDQQGMESQNLTAQKRLEQVSKEEIHEAKHLRYRIAQPPNGLPRRKSELSMPLTPTERNQD